MGDAVVRSTLHPGDSDIVVTMLTERIHLIHIRPSSSTDMSSIFTSELDTGMSNVILPVSCEQADVTFGPFLKLLEITQGGKTITDKRTK